MGMYPRTDLSEHEARAAQDLFDRIVAAERDILSDEQRADPRTYLLDAWEKACEAVMRPIHSRQSLEKQIAELRGSDQPSKFDWAELDD